MRRLSFAWLVFLLSLALAPFAFAQFPPAPGTGPGLAETIEAIDSARVTTRILYITAHPDDESAAVLTYLARGLHADVALLSLTRGEGGQNALGPEQAPQLGLIRTQELLAATRGYGVKLFFTRARDFGFSKTPEETEKIWGDQVTEDMVRIIRYFRPNIVINNWGGVHGGHGHHQAAGLLTPKAVALAQDASYKLPDSPDADKAISEDVIVLDLDRFSDKPTGYVLPLDDVSPLWGKTWREIGLDAFVNHHTQGIAGFLSSPFLRRPIALKREDGQQIDPQILARTLNQLAESFQQTACRPMESCRNAIRQADESIVAARKAVLELDWIKASQLLKRAEEGIVKLLPSDVSPPKVTVDDDALRSLQKVRSVIAKAEALVDGVEVDAIADTPNIVLGESFSVRVSQRCRSGIECASAGFVLTPQGTKVEKKEASGGTQNYSVVIEKHPPHLTAMDLLLPEPPPFLEVMQSVGGSTVAGTEMYRLFPVEYVAATSTRAEKVPLRIVPAYTVAVEPAQMVEVLNAQHKPFDVFLRVHSYSTKPAKISLGLDVPDGLTASAPVNLDFTGIGDQYAKLTVTPPAKLDAGNFTITAYAKRGDEKFSTSLEPLPSMPTLLWSEPSQCVVHAFDINVPPNLRVGYISAEGEPIPDALKRLGISVENLDANAITFGNLSKFDSIVVGVRAYELRPELAEANKRLLDYVSNGGTLVVQYNRDFVWDKIEPAPYPAKIGNPTPRITDENAAVKFLKPDDSLLNRPNKITDADFQNWIQERGLYFWSDFDSRYTPLLAMHDPGEKDLNGGLVYTRYGKGTYVYTGLAFFRQLPEGVPGAYRLFVNLLSASKPQ